ncbi:MAG: O-antigen ligase family protein [Bacteroidota bacterium]
MISPPWERQRLEEIIFWTSAGLSLTCALLAIWLEQYWLVGLPALPLAVYQFVIQPRFYFWLLLALLPLSVEFYLGSVGTDLPTEPLMLLLSFYFIIHALYYWRNYASSFYRHPISLILIAHLSWLCFSSLFSEGPLVSLKFCLAKFWYVLPFFFLAGRLLDDRKRVRRMVWLIFIPLLFVAVQTLVRHASFSFSFADQFRTMSPFMRNHVNYAAMLAAFAPWLAFLIWRQPQKRWLWAAAAVWLIAVYFSYTRAAYVSLFLAGGSWWIIRRGWIKPLLLLGLVGLIGGSLYLLRNNKYLEYAPNFETTIAHDRFDNLISATYKLEDISTMERAYRWVAAGHMVPYHPWTGWGPGNFIFFYEGHTVRSFATYVSDNPERSGIHNYLLMTLVEQGFPGLVLMLALLLGPLFYGQRAYLRKYKKYKTQASDALREELAILMAAILSVVIIDAFLLINDLLETDKIGALFFLNLAIIVNFSRSMPQRHLEV